MILFSSLEEKMKIIQINEWQFQNIYHVILQTQPSKHLHLLKNILSVFQLNASNSRQSLSSPVNQWEDYENHLHVKGLGETKQNTNYFSLFLISQHCEGV